jgi:hypothetical protein
MRLQIQKCTTAGGGHTVLPLWSKCWQGSKHGWQDPTNQDCIPKHSVWGRAYPRPDRWTHQMTCVDPVDKGHEASNIHVKNWGNCLGKGCWAGDSCWVSGLVLLGTSAHRSSWSRARGFAHLHFLVEDLQRLMTNQVFEDNPPWPGEQNGPWNTCRTIKSTHFMTCSQYYGWWKSAYSLKQSLTMEE